MYTKPIDRVLGRLERVEARNGHYTALCPNHNDKNPSLSIAEGDDGRVLLYCFTQCEPEDIVKAMGLGLKDLFPDNRGEGGVYPPNNTATVQHLTEDPHTNGEEPLQPPDATVCNSATPLEAGECTLDAYAGYVGLSVEFLRSLSLREIYYIDQKAVKIPYFGRSGEDEICVRFRLSLEGTPKIKTRKGDKNALYGLWKLGEAKEAGHVILVEGESDTQVAGTTASR